MRTQKSNNEGKTSKVLLFQLPITKDPKDAAPTRNTKKGNLKPISQLAARKKNASPNRSQPVPTLFISEEELQAQIAKRAFELFEQRERQHGNDREDWFRAEKDVLTQKDVG
ncbi:MAG: hypothetical protein NPIRA06_33380 [Nitrospirales bacterium]|nr:MAG: hypothetical protein NPIRA06_33380 [Nitrospirales bacterium]